MARLAMFGLLRVASLSHALLALLAVSLALQSGRTWLAAAAALLALPALTGAAPDGDSDGDGDGDELDAALHELLALEGAASRALSHLADARPAAADSAASCARAAFAFVRSVRAAHANTLARLRATEQELLLRGRAARVDEARLCS